MVLLILIGISCSNIDDKSKLRHYDIYLTLKSGKRLLVQDTLNYSSEFISELKTLDTEYDSVKLIGEYLIINKYDTIKIPTELPINETIIYHANTGDTTYLLGIKRKDFTNIDYYFKVNDKLIKSGQAILPASFILGSEFSELDDDTVIPLTQYFDKKDIWTCIKIEIGNANRVEFYMESKKDSTLIFKNVPILVRK